MSELTKQNILGCFSEVLSSLTDKEKLVIEKRIGLMWGKETLQSIGNSFAPAITRERVRQIEDAGIKKIWRIIKWTKLIEIQDKSREILALHGGLLSRNKLINAIIKEVSLDSDINKWVIDIIIQSDMDVEKSKPKLWVLTYFFLPTISKRSIDSVHREALKILKKKKDIMNIDVLYDMIKFNLKDLYKLGNVFLDSVLDLFEDIVKWWENQIALSKWRILNPKTLKDKSLYVMKKQKKPMHFVDISNEIFKQLWEQVKVNTVHNELIRNNEFVLIGRGIYALKEWWFKPGTVLDVVIDVMKKVWEPISTEEIVDKVLKVRDVRASTIYMNLQNRKYIERVWRNYYKLKD